MQFIMPYLQSTISYKFSSEPVINEIYKFATSKSFCSFDHFVHNFDVDLYIKGKMSKIYWEYIDKNIQNQISYRNRTNTNYHKKIRYLCMALENVTSHKNINSILKEDHVSSRKT